MALQESLRVLELAASRVDAVLVSFSGGKDSLAVLDLCQQVFKRVEAVFWYLVPGLRCEELMLKYAERRWDVTIHRVPSHFAVACVRSGMYSRPWFGCGTLPAIEQRDVEALLRKRTGIEWFAYGMRKADSAERNSWLGKTMGFGTVGRGIDVRSRRLYPICDWKARDVVA